MSQFSILRHSVPWFPLLVKNFPPYSFELQGIGMNWELEGVLDVV